MYTYINLRLCQPLALQWDGFSSLDGIAALVCKNERDATDAAKVRGTDDRELPKRWVVASTRRSAVPAVQPR